MGVDIQKKSSGTLCALAFSHLFISPQGEFKPCCRFRGQFDNKENREFTEIFSDGYWQKIREKMHKNERVDGCVRCYQEEDAGKKSLRLRYNEHEELGLQTIDIHDPKIVWLEIPFSNKCNVACRMCDSRYSTRWVREERIINGKEKADKPIFEFDLDKLIPIAQSLRHIKITGGEPLFDPNHKKFLNLLIENADPSEIYLNYSSNLTIFPNKEIIELWAKFKRVEIAMSLDSIFPNETHYMRYPSDGELVLNNSLLFIKLLYHMSNLHLILRSTVSIFNIYSIPDTMAWWFHQKKLNPEVQGRMSQNPTHLTFPDYQSVTVLSSCQKELVSKKFKIFYLQQNEEISYFLDYLEKYMYSDSNDELHQKFLLKTEVLDSLRKQKYQEIFSHLRVSQHE